MFQGIRQDNQNHHLWWAMKGHEFYIRVKHNGWTKVILHYSRLIIIHNNALFLAIFSLMSTLLAAHRPGSNQRLNQAGPYVHHAGDKCSSNGYL